MDPINSVDPSGGFVFDAQALDQILLFTGIGMAVGGVVAAMTDPSGDGDDIGRVIRGIAVGGAIGFGIGSGVFGDILYLGNSLLDVFRSDLEIDNRQIRRSLTDAQHALKEKINALEEEGEKEKRRFKNNFGVDDKESRNKIKEVLKKTEDAVNQYKKNAAYKRKIRRTSDYDDETFAYVDPNDPEKKINLEKQFWKARRRGYNSRLGTLVHEITHFADIGATQDHQYSKDGAKFLTRKGNVHLALENADNIEYFIEKVRL